MEDIYIFNYDCIQCVLNFDYLEFTYHSNIRFINKYFLKTSSKMFSAYYFFIPLIQLNLPNRLTSLQFKCLSFPSQNSPYNLWEQFINLQKLDIQITNASVWMEHFPITLNLTYLKIKCVNGYECFSFDGCKNLRCLNLNNVTICSWDSYSRKLTNLETLIHKYPYKSKVILLHACHSNLKYLKLNNLNSLSLLGMTQLQTKILSNINDIGNLA